MSTRWVIAAPDRFPGRRRRRAAPAVGGQGYRSGMGDGSLAVVERWLHAVNERDGTSLEALSHEQVEITGPRGSGPADRSVLSEWLRRAGFSAQAVRWFCGGDGTVVVEQDAAWDDPVTAAAQSRSRVASRFLVRDGLVARYVRHDAGVDDALRAAGLTVEDEVRHREPPGT